jgi:NTP pyrophosphatase (non-canonical NTP hydrolase)
MSGRNIQIENVRWAKKNFWEREFKDIAEKIVNGSNVMDPRHILNSAVCAAEVGRVRQILFEELGMFMPLAGMVEELGELAHALLKKRQGIRTNQDHDADARDAYGDLRIFGVDFCNRMGWVDEQVVEETWDGVLKRDWIKNPETGGADD